MFNNMFLDFHVRIEGNMARAEINSKFKVSSILTINLVVGMEGRQYSGRAVQR